MRKTIFLLAVFLCGESGIAQTAAPAQPAVAQKALAQEKLPGDWQQLARYRAENATVPVPKPGEARVVFMGDSITDFWGRQQGVFFPGKPYINRGIGGQMTGQMLVRFRPDVIALKPRAVVILAGTNDIVAGTDPATMEMIEGNLASMAELAHANGIKVVLASITPVNDYVQSNQTAIRPPDKIREINAWIKAYARRHHCIYLDYYPALLDAQRQLKKEYSDDGLHPNAAGYAVMAPLAQRAIDQALAK